MTIQEELAYIDTLQKKMFAFRTASSSLYLDGVTVAPKDTSEGRGVALGVLAGEEYSCFINETTGQVLTDLDTHKEELDALTRKKVEVLLREYKKSSRIPMDEYVAYAELTNQASDVWHRAKELNDFSLFQPVLEKLVAFKRKFAGYYDSTKKPYDALLNEYERGMTMEYLDQFFSVLREKLVPVIQAIGTVEQIDDRFLHKDYPIEIQRKFSDRIMDIMGIDKNHCCLGETEHPFTLNFTSQDVRITTNYKVDNLVDSMYSVIHEGGHAIYELNINPELDYTCLAGGSSMGIHESQSRLYENLIGRSKAFAHVIFPVAKEFFPEQLDGITEEQFYRAINKSEPSLIRTEADELTYCFHIMIRYEIEKQLIGGTLEVKDIPATWNRLYKEYLGVDVPSDREGCLQDSHWSGGDFGYFPSYALGSAYGAQMLKNMEKEFDVWGSVSQGNLAPVTAWLKDKIHRFGCSWEPAELRENACGPFDPSIFADYLKEKYCHLYGISLA